MPSPLRHRWLAWLVLITASPTPGPTAPAAGPALAASGLPASCAAPLRAAPNQGARLLREAPALEVLLLGEIHDSVADHAWQLRSLEAVSALRPRLALGLEMVATRKQPVLDRWNAGQLDEGALLEQLEWTRLWGHDANLYLPLLRWARQRGVPLLALNADPELVRRVRRQGWAAIPRAEREGIGTPAPAGASYQEQLRTAWRGHGGGSDAAELARFIDSQLLRDRAMAERIAAARRQHPERLVVALIGRGHLQDGDGVPRQLRDLGLRRLLALERPALPPACGPVPAGARLGAYLESADGAVWVRRLAAGSAGALAGLQPGDRILAVNDEPVERAGQVIRRVQLQPVGVPLRLTIERQGRRHRLMLRLPSAASGGAGGENGAVNHTASP
jgi:uncharacterized iron-regulated protein